MSAKKHYKHVHMSAEHQEVSNWRIQSWSQHWQKQNLKNQACKPRSWCDVWQLLTASRPKDTRDTEAADNVAGESENESTDRPAKRQRRSNSVSSLSSVSTISTTRSASEDERPAKSDRSGRSRPVKSPRRRERSLSSAPSEESRQKASISDRRSPVRMSRQRRHSSDSPDRSRRYRTRSRSPTADHRHRSRSPRINNHPSTNGRPAQKPRERSLSPYSRRLALTHAMSSNR